jgi:citrate synthase
MKFGHRVYATEHPRPIHPRMAAAELAGTRGDDTCFRMSRLTEEVVHAECGSNPSLDRRSVPAPRHATPLVTAR